MPSTSIVIAEPPSRPKRKAATKASAALIPLKRKRSTPSVTESDESVTNQYKLFPPTTFSPGEKQKKTNHQATTNPKQIDNLRHKDSRCPNSSKMTLMKLIQRNKLTLQSAHVHQHYRTLQNSTSRPIMKDQNHRWRSARPKDIMKVIATKTFNQNGWYLKQIWFKTI